MMVKKRCDLCSKIKSDNVQSDEKIFNRELKDILEKVTCVEVKPEQLSSLLICYECAIALLHAEPIVLKSRILVTRLAKLKFRKKSTSDTQNGDITLNLTQLGETNPAVGSDDAEADNEKKKDATSSNKATTPKKVTVRRKSVAKKQADSIIKEGLEGSPAASSTMAAVDMSLVENKSTPKSTPKKKATEQRANGPKKAVKSETEKGLATKPIIKVENSEKQNNEISKNLESSSSSALVSPKKTAGKRLMSEHSEGEGSPLKKMENLTSAISPIKNPKLSEKLENSKQPITATLKSPVYPLTSTVSPKKATGKRLVSEDSEVEATPFKKIKDPTSPDTPTKNSKLIEKLRNSQDFPVEKPSFATLASPKKSTGKRLMSEQSEAEAMPFKKMKDPTFTDAPHQNSQKSTDSSSVNAVRECMYCGKPFLHLDKYESHVRLQKCKLAEHSCKYEHCSRRFYKLQKMLEHMKKKHPEFEYEHENNNFDE